MLPVVSCFGVSRRAHERAPPAALHGKETKKACNPCRLQALGMMCRVSGSASRQVAARVLPLFRGIRPVPFLAADWL